jgi:hypothetical protein
MIDANAYVTAKTAGTVTLTNAGGGEISVSIPQYNPLNGQSVAPLVQTDYLTTIQQQNAETLAQISALQTLAAAQATLIADAQAILD